MLGDSGYDVNLTRTSGVASLDVARNTSGNATEDHVNALGPESSTTSIDALLYIVVVLLFYSFSIVVLMVKYIRREKEEAGLRLYYYEFVERDKFRSARFQNQQSLSRIMEEEAMLKFVDRDTGFASEEAKEAAGDECGICVKAHKKQETTV